MQISDEQRSHFAKGCMMISMRIYSGSEVTLDKNQITMKVGNNALPPEVYEIMEGSYKNNIKKGTASMVIKGIDNYGGTKEAKFKIAAKSMLWWWKKLYRQYWC